MAPDLAEASIDFRAFEQSDTERVSAEIEAIFAQPADDRRSYTPDRGRAFAAQVGSPAPDGLGPIGGLDRGPEAYILKSIIVPRRALLANLIRLICGANYG